MQTIELGRTGERVSHVALDVKLTGEQLERLDAAGA
jgi:hypothetical protein